MVLNVLENQFVIIVQAFNSIKKKDNAVWVGIEIAKIKFYISKGIKNKSI